MNALYPVGFFGFLFLNTLFNQWIVHSRPAQPVGALLLLGYALQGLTNPFLGHLGDLARARWGSRRPLVLFGAPVLVLIFAALWFGSVPAIAVPIYCLVFSAVLQPYLALIPAISPTEAARVRAMSIAMACALLAAAAALIAGPLVVERFGFAGLGPLGAGGFLLATLVPAALVRELKHSVAERSAAALPPRALAAQLGGLLMAARPRRFVLGATLLTATQMALVVSAPTVAGTLLHREQSATAVLNGILVAGMLSAVALMAKLGRRFAPLALLRAGAVLAALVLAALGASTALPPGFASEVLCAVCFFALGFVALAVVALPSLVAARLSDEDGQQREGVFFGLSGAANGLGNALGAFGAASCLALGGTTGLRATIVFAGLSAVAAAAVLPRAEGSRA